MKTQDLFVPFELAKQLKDKNFEPTLWFAWQFIDGSSGENRYEVRTSFGNKVMLGIPLFSQVTDWLLNVHNIFLSPTYCKGKIKQYDCFIETKDSIRFSGYKPTIQEAYTSAIEEALKLI